MKPRSFAVALLMFPLMAAGLPLPRIPFDVPAGFSQTLLASGLSRPVALVARILARRGGRLTHTHRNRYANDLRGLVRMGKGPLELIDRLMVSALIEARSCERFALLGEHCDDCELANLYRGLFASEAGHYRLFIDLARALPSVTAVDARWNVFLDAEAGIIAGQPPGSSMHSGVV